MKITFNVDSKPVTVDWNMCVGIVPSDEPEVPYQFYILFDHEEESPEFLKCYEWDENNKEAIDYVINSLIEEKDKIDYKLARISRDIHSTMVAHYAFATWALLDYMKEQGL